MSDPADSPANPSTRRQPAPGDVLDGTYRLDQQLGKGGVGVVFKAWHLHLQRPCAVKFLHPQLVSNEELRTRFRREAQSAFQLGHPHIVAITDFRDDPNSWPYIVMELVQGQTLRDQLESGPLPQTLAVRLMAQLCDALMTAHRRGVIHRDLKPENLILAKVDSPGPGEPDVSLKILDFGLSKLLDGMEAEITGTGRLLGSPSYMSPEQARGDSQKVDARSDIFSVGVLLFECLSGEKLFSTSNLEEKRQQIMEARLPPLGLVERGLPQQLERIIKKACARLPEERYQSAQSLLHALNGIGSGAKATGTMAAVGAPSATASVELVARPAPESSPSSSAGGELIPGPQPGAEPAPTPDLLTGGGRRSMVPVVAGLALAALAAVGYAGYTVLHAGSSTPTQPAAMVPPAEPPKPVETKPEPPVAVKPPEPATPPAPAPKDEPHEAVHAAAPPEAKPHATPPPAPETTPPPVAVQKPPVNPAVATGPRKWKPVGPVRPIATAPPGVKPPPLPPEEGAPTTQAAALSVNAVMRRAMGSVARCFPEGGAPPKVSVDVTVGTDGKASDVSADGADDHTSCVVGVIKGLRFAPATDSDSYSIRYDFVNLGLIKR